MRSIRSQFVLPILALALVACSPSEATKKATLSLKEVRPVHQASRLGFPGYPGMVLSLDQEDRVVWPIGIKMGEVVKAARDVVAQLQARRVKEMDASSELAIANKTSYSMRVVSINATVRIDGVDIATVDKDSKVSIIASDTGSIAFDYKVPGVIGTRSAELASSLRLAGVVNVQLRVGNDWSSEVALPFDITKPFLGDRFPWISDRFR
jgi:hypothetical protein